MRGRPSRHPDEQLHRRIEETLASQDMNLTELASALHLHPSTVSRSFARRAYSRTFARRFQTFSEEGVVAPKAETAGVSIGDLMHLLQELQATLPGALLALGEALDLRSRRE